METLKQAYKILFGLQFELTGFKDDLNQYLRLVPDQPSLDSLSFYKSFFRYQKNSVVNLIQVEADGPGQDELLVMLKNNEVFHLQLKFADSDFIRLTHLSSYDFSNNVLFLTNEINHTSGTEILLSVLPTNYNSGDAYKAGYLVQSGGSFYKALKESNSGNPHGVGETDYWKSIVNGGTYVSQADLRSRSSFSYPVDSDTILLIEIHYNGALNPAYQLIDASLKSREVSYKIKLLTGN